MTETTTAERKALNAQHAAEALDMPLRSLYRAIDRGEIHAVRISGRWYVPAGEIDRVLALPTRAGAD